MLHATGICSCLYQLRLKFVRRYVIKARLKCISCICHPLSISKWIITRTVNADCFVHCLFYMNILWGTKQVMILYPDKKQQKRQMITSQKDCCICSDVLIITKKQLLAISSNHECFEVLYPGYSHIPILMTYVVVLAMSLLN